jgi:hypothetical protein
MGSLHARSDIPASQPWPVGVHPSSRGALLRAGGFMRDDSHQYSGSGVGDDDRASAIGLYRNRRG